MSVYDWKFYKCVKQILDIDQVYIFGGSIRDELLHDFHANDFYKEQNEYFVKNPNADKKDFDYNNKDISPTTLGRFVIPNDIDLFISKEASIYVLKKLYKLFYVRISVVKDLAYIVKTLNNGLYTLNKIEIMTKISGKYYTVKLDMIVANGEIDNNTIFPLVDLDFNVNGLFYTKGRDIYLPDRGEYKTSTIALFRVIDDIKNMTARACCNVPVYRIDKLYMKNWTIVFNFKTYNFIESKNVVQDDSCVICTHSVTEFTKCVNFKNCICKIVICMACINSNYEKIDKCPSCRTPIIDTPDNLICARQELFVYKKYLM
uniref:RING-type domain-containing protein n=1 Tax=viral metagenome TaxID=1070528 RepID=A0A6C0JL88_9ZZZZ